jgi:hypothetical protein
MKQLGRTSGKFAVRALIFILAGYSTISYSAGDTERSSDFQMDANAPALNSNPGTSQIPPFAIRNPAAERPPMSGREKFQYYRSHTYGPKAGILLMATAAIYQARDSVPQWGQGLEGYGKRFASLYGWRSVKYSIQMGIGALLHEDPRYLPSKRSGIWQRALYATSRTFVSQKDNGGIRIGYSRFIGAFGSSYISRQWHPESYRTPREYFYTGALSIGFDAAGNVLREFWPDLKKRLRF